jgi:hypothetical protein
VRPRQKLGAHDRDSRHLCKVGGSLTQIFIGKLEQLETNVKNLWLRCVEATERAAFVMLQYLHAKPRVYNINNLLFVHSHKPNRGQQTLPLSNSLCAQCSQRDTQLLDSCCRIIEVEGRDSPLGVFLSFCDRPLVVSERSLRRRWWGSRRLLCIGILLGRMRV